MASSKAALASSSLSSSSMPVSISSQPSASTYLMSICRTGHPDSPLAAAAEVEDRSGYQSEDLVGKEHEGRGASWWFGWAL